jgi:hypothetical protein
VSQKLLRSKVPRTTSQFFLQQMLAMSPTGLKTRLDTLLHRPTGVLCCCSLQCYTPTAATYRCSRLPYIAVHSNFWDTLYKCSTGKIARELCRTNQDCLEIVRDSGLSTHRSEGLRVKNFSSLEDQRAPTEDIKRIK